MKRLLIFIVILSSFSCLNLSAASQFVTFTPSADALCIADHGIIPVISYDASDFKGIKIAVDNLKQDLKKVTGIDASILQNAKELRAGSILIGTIGKSLAIDDLIKKGKIDGRSLKGKREKFIITIINNQLVIVGSDKRGTIYGIYELSRQIGVSPWYDWADVPIVKHNHIYI